MLPQNSFMDLLTVKGIQKLKKKNIFPKKIPLLMVDVNGCFPCFSHQKIHLQQPVMLDAP
jgi:hypothetical protein